MDSSIALKIAKDPESLSEQLDGLLDHGEAVDRLLARHPKASGVLLEKLSHSSDRTTRKYVAVNPNTTKELRLKLAPQFPSWTAAQRPPKLLQVIAPPVYDGPEGACSAMKFLDGNTIQVGQIVFHSKFGNGEVLSVAVDGRHGHVAQVNFGRHGAKWLALAIAKLSLVE